MHHNQDLNTALFPKNRRSVFRELLKYHKSLLFNMGLLLLCFSLPLIVVNVWSNLAMGRIASSGLSDEAIYQAMFNALLTKNILYLPASLFFGLGLSGVIQILHEQIWAEDIIIKADFKKGIKSNYLIVAITLIIACLLNFSLQYLLFLNTALSTSYKVALGIVIALCIIFSPIIILMWSSSIIYHLPFLGHLKNSLLLAMRKSYLMFPLGLLNLSFILFTILPLGYGIYVCFLVLPLVIAPVLICLNLLCCDAIFDEFINKEHFPEIYRKGMQKDE